PKTKRDRMIGAPAAIYRGIPKCGDVEIQRTLVEAAGILLRKSKRDSLKARRSASLIGEAYHGGR
ncbi:hypothetical protein, partial [Rhizobium mesoamericanum]